MSEKKTKRCMEKKEGDLRDSEKKDNFDFNNFSKKDFFKKDFFKKDFSKKDLIDSNINININTNIQVCYSHKLQSLLEDRKLLLKKLGYSKKWKKAGYIKRFFWKYLWFGFIYEQCYDLEFLIIEDLEDNEEEIKDLLGISNPYSENTIKW